MRSSHVGSRQWLSRISTLVSEPSPPSSRRVHRNTSNSSNVKIVPSGISRAARKLLQGKVPDLSRFNDISDYMYREGNASESEDEGAANNDENEVIVSQQLRSRGNLKANQSAIRLTEIGPRMTLELVKIEDGLCDGEVLFHNHVSKTAAEVSELRKRNTDKKRLKEERKRQQEANVQRKQAGKKPKASPSAPMPSSDQDADDEEYDE
jgi:ribosome biogenesis protein SSF1/2